MSSAPSVATGTPESTARNAGASPGSARPASRVSAALDTATTRASPAPPPPPPPAPAFKPDRGSALRERRRQLDPGLGHAFQGLGPRRDRRQLPGHELGGLLGHLMEVRQPHARHQPAQLLADGLGNSGRGISLGEEQSGAQRKGSHGEGGALGLSSHG